MIDSYLLSDIMKTNMIMEYIKTIDPLFLMLGYIIYNIYKHLEYEHICNFIFHIKCRNGVNYNEVVLSGDYCIRHTSYNSKTTTLFGENFTAMWDYINKKNDYITRVKEVNNIQDSDGEITYLENMYISNQDTPFVIKEGLIYGKVSIIISENDAKDYVSIRNEQIKLTLFSYILTCTEIQDFIETINTIRKEKINSKKRDNKYIYTLKKIDGEGDLHWYENEFESKRTFDSMYLEDKTKILNEIEFFTNNEKWYIDNGEPYNLGIGLKGLPGTGKTTFIKSLANKLNRHIIQIPLNRIHTEEDFCKAFYEKKYVNTNDTNINFKDKIIVFEDIDCMSDIVIKRDEENEKKLKDIIDNYVMPTTNNDGKSKEITKVGNKNQISLSFILNTIDGLIETNGRIIIISSNYYDKLDEALVRSGRIDMLLEFKMYTFEIIEQIYFKYYKKYFTKSEKQKLNRISILPCDVVNIRKKSFDNKDFISNLYKYMIN